MNSDSAFNYFEILMLGMFAAGWAVLEWQGRRLDRKREAERGKGRKEDKVANATIFVSHRRQAAR